MAKRLETDIGTTASQSNLVGIDVDAASELIDELTNARHEIQSANQNAGQIVKRAEKELGCNTKAFKMVLALETAGEEAAQDFWRTLIPLAERRGVGPRKDMVDVMEGKA